MKITNISHDIKQLRSCSQSYRKDVNCPRRRATDLLLPLICDVLNKTLSSRRSWWSLIAVIFPRHHHQLEGLDPLSRTRGSNMQISRVVCKYQLKARWKGASAPSRRCDKRSALNCLFPVRVEDTRCVRVHVFARWSRAVDKCICLLIYGLQVWYWLQLTRITVWIMQFHTFLNTQWTLYM